MASYKDIQGFNIQNLTSDPVPFAQAKENNPYGGTWASGGSYNTARYNPGAGGNLTSGLLAGGEWPISFNSGLVELYDGTSWTETTDLNTARQLPKTTGTVNTAIIVTGGYDQPGGGEATPIVLPPKQTPKMVSGGGGSTIIPIGSGDVLNSYYKAQLLGFLYKQG